jgi:outer membrane lipoprotein-sorting protein
MSNFLFSVDPTSEEVTVSESPKGSNQINFIERISRQQNEVLYNSVVTLTSITKSTDFNLPVFKSMDKVCQLVYSNHKK